MKPYLLIIILSFSLTLNAQVLFNKVYDFGVVNDVGVDIIQTQDNNYLVANRYQSLVKIDNLGDTVWTKKYTDFDIKAITELSDGSIILGGAANDSTFIEGALIKVTVNGNEVWRKKYGYREFNIITKVATSATGNIFVTGYTRNLPTTSDSTVANGWFFKTDSIGNIIFDKQLNFVKNEDVFLNLRVNNDESVYCVGFSYDSLNIHGLLSYYNTNGDTIYTKKYTDITRIEDIKMTPDNNFIVVGSVNNGNQDKAVAKKITPTASTLWNKSYARDTNDYSFKVVELIYNNLFLVGGTDYDLTQSPITERVRFMVLDVLGDSLWSEQYSYSGGTSKNYLAEMTLNTNGGFAFTGYNITSSIDLWVVNLDSIDCNNFINGCLTLNLPEDKQTRGFYFKIYPNPSKGFFTVQQSNFETGVLTIEVYNLMGKQLLKQKLTNTKINVDHFTVGVYLVRVVDNHGNEVHLEKLIVQK